MTVEWTEIECDCPNCVLSRYEAARAAYLAWARECGKPFKKGAQMTDERTYQYDGTGICLRCGLPFGQHVIRNTIGNPKGMACCPTKQTNTPPA